MQGCFHSPDRLLASFFLGVSDAAPHLFLVSGPSGAGKTTWCMQLLVQARRCGIPARGLLSPAVWAAGQKTAIDLLDVHSGERRRLAEARHIADESDSAGPATKGWLFSQATLDWGNRVLETCLRELLQEEPAAVGELLLVDELGPLEFLHGQGLQAGLVLLDAWAHSALARSGTWACVVIRPALLPLAQARWPMGRVKELRARCQI